MGLSSILSSFNKTKIKLEQFVEHNSNVIKSAESNLRAQKLEQTTAENALKSVKGLLGEDINKF